MGGIASWLGWHGLVVERVERENLLRDGLGFGRSWSLVVLTGPLFFSLLEPGCGEQLCRDYVMWISTVRYDGLSGKTSFS